MGCVNHTFIESFPREIGKMDRRVSRERKKKKKKNTDGKANDSRVSEEI